MNEGSKGGRVNVLIAEDNADDRKLLRLNLEHHGCHVFEAGDGKEALAIARKQKPALIISDALMPKMDGFQLLRAVKTDEDLKDIPFIFYSAVYTGYREAELAISLGASAFIIKPREPAELWAEIKDLLDNCNLRKKDEELTARLIEEDEEFLNKYSQVVATKLEDKVKELEAAKKALKASEEKYRSLVEHSLVGVYQSKVDGSFIYVNNAMANMFEFGTPAEMMASDILSLYRTPEKRDAMIDELKRHGKIEDYEIIGTTRKGNPITVMISATIKDNLISGVAIDVTQQKKLEAQLRQAQKMEAVGQLTGGIAHDFNNILSVIVGYSSLLQMKMKEGDPIRDDLDQILAASERAAAMIQSLLAYSRKQTLNPKPVSLNGIITRMQRLLERVISEDVHFTIALDKEDSIIMADSGQIDQVLMNIVANARDAMPDGGSLTIETGRTEFDAEYMKQQGYGMPGAYAFLSISDSGTGMDEETKCRAFDPFFTTKEVGKGTGLGLAMVYGIIKQHNGFVNCYSEPGKGTTFKIYLPLYRASELAKETNNWTHAPLGKGTGTILVAEDEAHLRRLASSVLKEFGYDVLLASDGQEALEMFRDNKDAINLVILDVIMPRKNGHQVFEEIQLMKPGQKVIFTSGYTEDIVHQRGLLSAGLPFITKPFSPRTLLLKIREVLDVK